MKMGAIKIKIILFICWIKYSMFDKGSITDVHMNKKFACPLAAMESFFVKSEIQCTHRCLRRKCKLLNYKNEGTDSENCEVFMESGGCSIEMNQKNWKAVTLEVSKSYRKMFEKAARIKSI